MSKRYLKEIDRLLGIIGAFRDLDPKGQLPLQTVQTFILVMRNPGCSQQLLIGQTGLSQSSVSRNLQLLSEWAQAGKPGLALVQSIDDPNDTRRKRFFLTREGEKIAQKVLGYITDGTVSDYDAPSGKAFVASARRAAMG